ncbi:MAG: 30S ribosomal protein S8 [Candidatus Omnitrophica bacterium CG07_land_8_20_14_0_80_42_15]|uniref:Small ribosomal subunit protein uS8 n=1 Tax=Candidatus Aquitaenariimonas noxiae TaxID=1974741 RepID=A0A2J0L787_9BACT|nr:MAG: 30S ribosomal protein S8 [Candidatus Omnitrophica bacterium CG07_land_8_20_14_0_80_42_15]
MSVTDPIANMLTVIRNASRAGKETANVKASKLSEEIIKKLKAKKLISNYKKIEDNKQGILRVYLRFLNEKTPAITELKRISKPGLRRYVKKDEIPKVLGGMGFAIISTPKGLLTDEEARKQGIGGEVILHAW